MTNTEDKMKRSRKVFYILVCAISICFMQKCEVYAEDSAHTRVIQVVYDDSGSMIKNSGGESVDTWCQAKYAMEVFAALLGEQDTLNVYVMSDFNNGATAEPHLILNGKDGAEVNVEKIHNMITRASNTPFNTVKKAYEDLKKAHYFKKIISERNLSRYRQSDLLL